MIYTAGDARLLHCIKTNAIVVKLPYPVSANVMWRNVGKSITVLSEQARAYKALVKRLYIPLLKQIGFIAFDCPIEARIEVQPFSQSKNFSEKTFPRYDADNYQKCIFDALKGSDLIYIDDKQIVCPTLRFAEPATHGCVWVSIRPSERTWMDQPVDFEWLLNLKTEAA
jgi:crossover junction endodeoxyribonuclease RusA